MGDSSASRGAPASPIPDHTREVLSPEIEFHVLELPKQHLATAERQAKLERWARFLRAQTVEELEELAKEDRVMTAARNVLEELSQDPNAQRLAREREMAVLVHQHLIASSLEKGELGGMNRVLERQLTKKFGGLEPEVHERLSNASADDLERWAERILTADTIETVFAE